MNNEQPHGTLTCAETPDSFRMILEFNEIDRMEEFIAFIGEAADDGRLDVHFAWGAEAVHRYEMSEHTPQSDTGSGEIVDPLFCGTCGGPLSDSGNCGSCEAVPGIDDLED